MSTNTHIIKSTFFPKYEFSIYVLPRGKVNGGNIQEIATGKCVSPKEAFPDDTLKRTGLHYELIRNMGKLDNSETWDLYRGYISHLKRMHQDRDYSFDKNVANINDTVLKLFQLSHYDSDIEEFEINGDKVLAKTKKDAKIVQQAMNHPTEDS